MFSAMQKSKYFGIPYSYTKETYNHFLLTTIQNVTLDGNNFNITNLDNDGNPIVISFWATWCKPCIVEMPGLTRAQEILKDYNYIFLLVSDERISKIAKFKNDKKYNFNYLKSVGSNEILGIYSLPTVYIFNEKVLGHLE